MVEFSLVIAESVHGTTITVVGDVDLATAPELRSALLAAAGDLVVDLASVSFMDSSGLSALVAGHQHVTEAGHRFTLRNESELVEQTMKLTGLYDFLHSHPDSSGEG